MKDKEKKGKDRKRGNQWIIFLIGGGILIGLVLGLFWAADFRFKERTSNAYVNGNRIAITPQVSGIVKGIHVDNTDYVEEGDLLVELDEATYCLEYEKAKSALAEAVRTVAQGFIQVERLRAEVQKKEVERVLAQEAYQRRVELAEIGGVSQEEFSRAHASVQAAQASSQEAYFALKEVEAFVQNTTVETHPNVKKMADHVRETFLNLERCKILSPVSGCVAQKKVQLGEAVAFGQPLLEVIPLDALWVEANYKETQLSKVQVGQQVEMTSDLYGKEVVYRGEVFGIHPGTGSVFALLPPQNATGNWIKVVQRVPVRIRLDPVQLHQYPLWLGLSMDVVIDIRGGYKEKLKGPNSFRSIYKTTIYQDKKETIETVIRKIILENSKHG